MKDLRQTVKEHYRTIRSIGERWEYAVSKESMDALIDLAERVLAVEGKGILPTRKPYPIGHTQPTCQCIQCVRTDGRNRTIDEMSIRLASVGKGILPERKEEREAIDYYGDGKDIRYRDNEGAKIWNSCLDQTKINMAANRNCYGAERDDYIAWCPKCFDALDCTGIKDRKGIVIKYEYHCFGCDKTFVLAAAEMREGK